MTAPGRAQGSTARQDHPLSSQTTGWVLRQGGQKRWKHCFLPSFQSLSVRELDHSLAEPPSPPMACVRHHAAKGWVAAFLILHPSANATSLLASTHAAPPQYPFLSDMVFSTEAKNSSAGSARLVSRGAQGACWSTGWHTRGVHEARARGQPAPNRTRRAILAKPPSRSSARQVVEAGDIGTAC